MPSPLRILVLTCVISLTSLSAALAQQPDPGLAAGTWKLNPGRSKLAGPVPRSRVHTIEHRGGGVVVNRIEETSADGGTVTTVWTEKADGTDYPMMLVRDGTPTSQTIRSTRVDAYTVRWAIRNASGVVTASGTRTVSKDGTSFTNTIGDIIEAVYEKQ